MLQILLFMLYLVYFLQCVENCRQTCSVYSDYLLNYGNFIGLVIALEVFSRVKSLVGERTVAFPPLVQMYLQYITCRIVD